MTHDEHERRIAALKARHAHLFAGQHIGHTIAPGWLPILATLCARIDGALADPERSRVHFLQIKEKFGGLRCYLNVAPPRLDLMAADGSARFSGHLLDERTSELFERLEPFVQQAEMTSFQICIFCGAPGRLRAEERRWLLTLCDRHAPYGYHHLDAAFELLTDHDRDLPHLTLAEVAALLAPGRASLRDLGVVHLGLLPPRKPGMPARLVVESREEPDGAPLIAIEREAVQRTGCLLETVGRNWLRYEPDRPEHGDVDWIF